MALYAIDDDNLIYAPDANFGKTYWCLSCFGPVKKRRGSLIWRPHFYHLKTTKSCRLHSKSNDHMLAQLQLQKTFPAGEIQLERPFPEICRVADACWEKEKIIFEIQCSSISEKEAKQRIFDYSARGYEVIWLLDDRRFNKKKLRPAEKYLRKRSAYYLKIKQDLQSDVYDQFEIFSENSRINKSSPLYIDLRKPKKAPQTIPHHNLIPRQALERASKNYFYGDCLDKALKGPFPWLSYWKKEELKEKLDKSLVSRFLRWVQEIAIPRYLSFLKKLENQTSRTKRF